jgi:hypothetical protein
MDPFKGSYVQEGAKGSRTSGFDSDKNSDKSIFGEIGSSVGQLVTDIFGNVKSGVSEAIGMVTSPGKALTESARAAVSESAQPFTSIIDVWLPGEPVQDAWNAFVNRGVEGTSKRIDSSLSSASKALGIEFDNERSSKSPTGEGFGAKFNEYIKDVERELSGDKKVQTVAPRSQSSTPKSTSNTKKKKRTRKGRQRRGKSFVKGNTITRYN